MRYWRTHTLTLLVWAWATLQLAGPALADDKSPGKYGLFNVLDRKDSRGVWVSQYQIYMDRGNLLTNTEQWINSFLFLPLWEFYRWCVSATSILLDYAVTFEWAKLLVVPLDGIGGQIRTHLMQPLGLTGWGQNGLLALILTIAASIGVWKAVTTSTADGLRQLITSAVMAALAVTMFSAPFAAVVGDQAALSKPLRYSQQIGSETSSLIVSGTVPTGEITDHPKPPKLGQVYVDAMIRPIHQGVNFGRSIDRDMVTCIGPYDEALKGGPYDVGDSKPRDKIGSCDKSLKEYAGSVNIGWFLTLLAMSGAGFTLTVLTLMYALFVGYTVLSLAIASFRLMITSLWAIMPGSSRAGMLRDLASIISGTLYLGGSMIAMSVGLAITKHFLEATASWPLLLSYIALNCGLLISCVLVWLSWRWKRNGQNGLWKRLMNALGTEGKPSMLRRARSWSCSPRERG